MKAKRRVDTRHVRASASTILQPLAAGDESIRIQSPLSLHPLLPLSLRRGDAVLPMASASASAGGETPLVDRCIDAAAGGAATVEAWRRQRRSLERLPAQLADALLRRLAARRLLFPSLLEVFQHSVEEIDLSGHIAVDAEWLAYLGAFRYLRVLKLADCKNVNSSAVWALSGMSTLKELDLSRCSKISDAGIKHIASIESLEKLHVSQTGLTDNGVMAISSLINLRLLDLGGVRFTDKALRSLQAVSMLVMVLTQLEHLDIWGSEITNEGASVLIAFTSLSFLNISWTPSFGNIDEVFSSILPSSLTYLDMSSCSSSNLYFLGNMRNLEHLDLSYSRIISDAIEYIANIGMNLMFLSLSNSEVTSQALCVLAGTVPSLTTLSLAHTKIDDSALLYISMMPSLRTLNLSRTCIKGFMMENSVKVLSLSALEELKYLESLNLNNTQLMDDVIPPLASFRALKYLFLKSDFLSDPALHALSSASNLIHLGFCGNILSTTGLRKFVPPATLRMLDLSGCWILTGDAISAFCTCHPVIEVRHELIQELQANYGGTSHLHKSSRQPQQVKAKVAKSLAGPSRLADICFVDEKIKYSKEEMMELQHQAKSNSSMNVAQLPPELRRSV
uniref:Disease resistance R13L4/SHOC-2-like LRR domain-containing protein n=1 Tax=Oryza nivara TaxID=4536 RepID=A0A0E0HB32_ORYNI